MVEHHVTGLEVAIEKTDYRPLTTDSRLLKSQILSKQTEIGFQFQLVEVEFCSFEETVLEIVQVEEHTILIELSLRVAVREIKPSCSPYLDVGQLPDSTFQQFLLLQSISSASLSSTSDSIEERKRPKVCLKIAQLVVTGSENLRHRQLTSVEMFSQIDESMVFVTAGSDDTDNSLAVVVRQSEIGTITASTRNLLDVGWL